MSFLVLLGAMVALAAIGPVQAADGEAQTVTLTLTEVFEETVEFESAGQVNSYLVDTEPGCTLKFYVKDGDFPGTIWEATATSLYEDQVLDQVTTRGNGSLFYPSDFAAIPLETGTARIDLAYAEGPTTFPTSMTVAFFCAIRPAAERTSQVVPLNQSVGVPKPPQPPFSFPQATQSPQLGVNGCVSFNIGGLKLNFCSRGAQQMQVQGTLPTPSNFGGLTFATQNGLSTSVSSFMWGFTPVMLNSPMPGFLRVVEYYPNGFPQVYNFNTFVSGWTQFGFICDAQGVHSLIVNVGTWWSNWIYANCL